MKSYTESKGITPFNWEKFLSAKSHTHESWCKAQDLASVWPTCMCGKQDYRISRDDIGSPSDSILRDLGIEFCVFIDGKDTKNARKTMVEIEKRAAQILKSL